MAGDLHRDDLARVAHDKIPIRLQECGGYITYSLRVFFQKDLFLQMANSGQCLRFWVFEDDHFIKMRIFT